MSKGGKRKPPASPRADARGHHEGLELEIHRQGLGVAMFLFTLIDISHELGAIRRELSNIEDNTARTFKILANEAVKVEVQR